MNSLERRSTFALSSIFALRMLGLFMIIPVFSVVGRQYQGATPGLIGLAVGIYGLAQACLQIPFSLLADRFNRKILIVIGLALFSLGGAVAGLSHSIEGVIIGRALAGAGAVSAVVMALLSDVTREEERSKAMAIMGMSIGLSFVTAFSVGPWLTHQVGISGLFWLTTVMGLLAMLMLVLVPKVERHHRPVEQSYAMQLKHVLMMPQLNRLHLSIFMLHLLMTAMFVYLPSQLIYQAHIPLAQQGWVYLPLLIVGALTAIPGILWAEKRQKMRHIFLAAIATIALGLFIMALGHGQKWYLLTGIGLFFIAFNVMEALLPSWLSKIAPLQSKSTAMGVNSTAQFLGAFFGGVLGGQLLKWHDNHWGWLSLAVLSTVWIVLALGLRQPRYLSSIVVRIGAETVPAQLSASLLQVRGVEEVIVMPQTAVAYLKVDKSQLDDTARQQLSHLVGQPIAF